MQREELSNQSPDPDSQSPLIRFIEAARAQGASDEFISKLLKSFGWSQREIERAFFQVYEKLTGMSIPTPTGQSGELARDAFLYLLSFLALAIWTQGLGQLGFIFIDVFFPDPLEEWRGYSAYAVAKLALARLIVAFPVYLLLMRLILRELAINPEKYQSGIRKWLTYLALLIAACIVIGTLIVFLTSFLRGDLTIRFVLKVIVVFAIASAVFWYYFTWLRRRPTGA